MGHVTVVGGCRAKAPSTGILASSLAVGTTVKLTSEVCHCRLL